MFSDSTGPNQWVPFDSRVDAVASFQRLFGSGPYGHMVWTCFILQSALFWSSQGTHGKNLLAAAQT